MKKKTNSIESLKEEGKITTADKIVDQNGVEWSYDESRNISWSSSIDGVLPITDLVGYSVDMSKVSPDILEKIKSLPIKWVRFQDWIKQIEDYCSSVGILPEDLIKMHREANKGFKSKTNTLQQGIQEIEAIKPIGGKKDHSSWNENYKKRKLFGD